MTRMSTTPKHSYSATQCTAYFVLFAILILGGVAMKRIWGHPEFMMLFHLPAAVFLVLGGIELRKRSKHLYDAEVEEVRRKLPRQGPAAD